MSTGARLPLQTARNAAAALFPIWKMREPACMAVGSVRRQRPDVGDLEFIAPAPLDPKRDELFDAIEATLPTDGLIFGGERPTIAEAVRGVKRGFYAASLIVNLRLGDQPEPTRVPVQIFRYDAGDRTNRGWTELMRTGPSDLGIWFLQEWKRVYGIQNGPASVDGHLVDANLQRVPAEDEETLFRIIRHDFIPPEQRDAFVAHINAGRARESREALR